MSNGLHLVVEPDDEVPEFFGPHKVVAVDLSGLNATIDRPADFIVGYPTIRQANWVFDFPAKRWGFAG